jgi:pantoate--beta-alanine ligase
MTLQVLETLPALRSQRATWRSAGERLALVPTMGNLHPGHLGLVTQAKAHADRVLVTLFVNPSQFGPGEDFERYPRTLEADLEALASVGCDAVFVPAVSTIYPEGLPPRTRVCPGPLAEQLCGANRPGHFEGVATVVLRLFNMAEPELALFGQKDYQQLMIIRQLVEDLALPIEIVGAPIARAEDGLALSSRNGYLSEEQRSKAPALHRALRALAEGPGDAWLERCEEGRQALEAQGFVVDYLTVRRQADLAPAEADDSALIALVAAKLGSTRLIDNLCFTRKDAP